ITEEDSGKKGSFEVKVNGQNEPEEKTVDPDSKPVDEGGVIAATGKGGEEPEEVAEEESSDLVTPASEPVNITADREPGEIKENIIDKIILVREDGTEYEEGDLLGPDEDLELHLLWSLPEDPVYIAGDTFKFQLPKQLIIYSVIEGNLDEFDTYYVDLDGNVTFTFNEQIENNSEVVGDFWVKTSLDKQEIQKTTEELEFVMSDGEVEKVTI